MDNKYFIPEISDYCIGYELEWKRQHTPVRFPSSPEIYDWQKHILTLEDFSDHDLADEFHNITFDANEFRVPYLTKEQIEKEGWKLYHKRAEFRKFTGIYDSEDDLTGTEYLLDYNEKTNRLIIEAGTINFGKADYPYEGHNNIFNGKIKCINEFRKLIKLLEI